MSLARGGRVDRMLQPIHRWIWSDDTRRLRKLLAFAEVEADGGRDILRAAEVTADPLLRRLYLEHAIDELHHADLFRERSLSLLCERGLPLAASTAGPLMSPGGHGLDDLRVDEESDESLLAFLHLSEKAAAARFAIYRDVVSGDQSTTAVFDEILRDEVFHMNYTYTQLTRVSPAGYRRRLWTARLSRLWKRYLRVAAALAGVVGTAMLTVQYFVLLPPFAWLARRAERREGVGWIPIGDRRSSPTSQY